MDKTTIAGFLGILGQLLAVVGYANQHRTWGYTLFVTGVALGGAHGVGNILSPDKSDTVMNP